MDNHLAWLGMGVDVGFAIFPYGHFFFFFFLMIYDELNGMFDVCIHPVEMSSRRKAPYDHPEKSINERSSSNNPIIY